MLMSSDRKRLIRYLGSESRIIVKKEVEVIEETCFWGCSSLREVSFQKGSELRGIKEYAFWNASLDKLEIPPKCQFLAVLSPREVKSVTVSKENPFLVVADNMLMSSDRKRLIRYFGSESRIVVKKGVEVIGKYCFDSCRSHCEVLFEDGSRLRSIEYRAFRYCVLKRIVIPAGVEVIGKECFGSCSIREFAFERESKLKEIEGGAFFNSRLDKLEIPSKCQIWTPSSMSDVKSVTVSKENPFFRVEESFLKTSDGKHLIRYMGSEQQIVVKKEVEVIEELCFSRNKDLIEVIFEEGSRLRLIDECAFFRTGLKSIGIPASVEVIGDRCFCDSQNLCEVTFERESNLKEIKNRAFFATNLRNLEIPSKCQFLTGSSLNGMKSFSISKENPFLRVEGRFLKSTDRKRLIWYMGSEKKVVVKREVEVIGEKCFFACLNLHEVVYEGQVRGIEIGKDAFAH
jgi:hypothetical protein